MKKLKMKTVDKMKQLLIYNKRRKEWKQILEISIQKYMVYQKFQERIIKKKLPSKLLKQI